MKLNPIIETVLKSACAARNQHLRTQEPEKKKRDKKVSKEKTWILFKLKVFANENNLILSREYTFHEERDWRFDWCFLSIKVAIEYEGIVSKKSRHTTLPGYTGDVEKYNAAVQEGWRVLRFTALNYLDLTIELNNLK